MNAILDDGADLSAEEVLDLALARFAPGKVAFATSFGVEDQVLTHLLAARKAKVRFFTLDTGRLFPEVYDVMQRTMEKYGLSIEVFAPDACGLQDLVRVKGPNLFYRSVEDRKECCRVRKVVPLKKALAGREAWICGLRRSQSVTRDDLRPIEWDEANGLFKIAPLCSWSEERTWDFARKEGVPICPLQEKGFRSLGCAPCTRAVEPGDDVRAGRWWWETPEKRECGLHGRRGGNNDGRA